MANLKKNEMLAILKDRVLTLKLAPGELLDEVELAEAFGVSRTPLRETLQRLAGEGYVVVEKNKGAKVAPMDLETLRQFFQVAPMIYASIARLAAENGTSAELGELKSIQREYRASFADGDASRTAMHNHHFHAQIGRMSASTYLLPSLNRLLIDHTRIGQKFYKTREPDDTARIAKAADQHDAMIEAIERRAPAEAVETTLQHWALSRDEMERYVRPEPLSHELTGEPARELEGDSDAV